MQVKEEFWVSGLGFKKFFMWELPEVCQINFLQSGKRRPLVSSFLTILYTLASLRVPAPIREMPTIKNPTYVRYRVNALLTVQPETLIRTYPAVDHL